MVFKKGIANEKQLFKTELQNTFYVFNYLGCDISYEVDDDVSNKMHWYQKNLRRNKQNIKMARKETQLKSS